MKRQRRDIQTYSCHAQGWEVSRGWNLSVKDNPASVCVCFLTQVVASDSSLGGTVWRWDGELNRQAVLRWDSAAETVPWFEPFPSQSATKLHLCPLQFLKYARVWGHVSLISTGSVFFSLLIFFLFPFSTQEQGYNHPHRHQSSSLMAKWFYITWRLTACDIGGWANRDTPGRAWWHWC